MIALPFPGFANPLLQRYPVVSMDFEAGAGGTTFTDDGTAGSTWTRSGSNVTTDTGVILDGISSLRVNGDSDYLETALTSANGLPASGDWDLEVRFRMGNVTSRYILSAQGTAFSASDTQFAVVTGSGARVAFVISNGTTRQLLFNSAAEQINANQTYLLRISRRQDLYAIGFDGSVSSTATFSGNINQPAGRKIRIGLGEGSGTVTGSALYVDSFRIFRYA